MPVILAFFAAALWGVWWMPMRWLQGYGLDGAQGNVLMMLGAAVFCVPVLVFRPGLLRMSGRAWIGAILTGAAFTSYSAALNYSDVVRVILLFYLAPVWSKLIERFFLGMAWRWPSTLALGMAMGGAALLLGAGAIEGGIRSGDVMAILSGMAWATGAALIYKSPGTSAVGLSAISVICTLAVSLFFVAIDGAPMPDLAASPELRSVLLPALALGAVYIIPVLFMTLWSAQRLAPATLSFLLTAELLFGVVSGAIWLDEPFGWPQAVGALLILMAALTEVLVKSGPDQLRT